jgi:SAM-dependent methyltransferase
MDLAILKCPITGSSLTEASSDIIDKINATNTQKVKIERGLVNESKSVFYPILRDVIALLPHYAIKLTDAVETTTMQFDKDRVFRYYNDIKYEKYENTVLYSDSNKWIDYRDVSKAYLSNSFSRAKKYLDYAGKYYLDIASGPIGFVEYIELSERFDTRICIDISLEALFQAVENFKGKDGIFICGDITNIPLQDGVCDAVLSQHTLYHIPKNEQATAVTEMYRVCKTGGKVAIIYNWFFYSWFMNIVLFPVQVYRLIRHYLGKLYVKFFPDKPRLYFFVYPPSWFKQFPFYDNLTIYSWRSVNKYFLDTYIHKGLGGATILKKLQDLEDKYPKFFGRVGDYPIIVIEKK